jgi:TolB-like protein
VAPPDSMTLLQELKRRNVIRVGVAYIIASWVIAQVAEFAFENFGAPPWVLKSLIVVLLLGLPLVLIFAWAFELTPEGLKREVQVDRSASITSQTGRKLDRTIIAVLVVALAWFGWDRFFATTDVPTDVTVVQEEPDAGGGSVLGQPANKSVAVLPFVAMSSGTDDEYFADGLTEEILNSLAQLPELLVTARTSAFSFKGQDIPIQEIAAALGVRHIVEGSVRRSGDRLRVTAQLIRAEDAFHLWSKNYDSTSTDTIAVQEDIAEQIAAALDVVLDETKREAMRQAGLKDAKAFTLYQKGLDRFEQAHEETDTPAGLREANEFFEQVIALVPDFALVYVEHSEYYAHLLGDDAAAASRSSIEDAEIADILAAAIKDYEAAIRHARSPEWRDTIDAERVFISGSWRGLADRFEKSVGQESCNDGNWSSIIAAAFGYSATFFERAEERLACDPRRSLSWFSASRAALMSGDKESALKLAIEGSDVAPGLWLSSAWVRALLANGKPKDALEVIKSKVPDDDFVVFLQALVAASQGDQAGVDQNSDAIREIENAGIFWPLIVEAWSGHREAANEMAARIDAHPFGAVTLAMISVWCDCGAPWDLDATPNFAARLKEGNLNWPPPPSIEFPLKDW